MDDDASHGSPGTDLVPLSGARRLPRELVLAADLALGSGARTLRVALRFGAVGRETARVGLGIARRLPGAGLAARTLSAATRPLVDDGARVRSRAVAEAQRTLEAVVPAIVAMVDVDAIVRRIDVNALVRRVDANALIASVDANALLQRVDADALIASVDVDALLRQTDVDALLRRVDVDAFLAGLDVDAVIARVDVNAIADRIDVNAIVQQVDVDAIVEETELGTIVARSTSGFATEALDAARAQTVGVDTLVTRLVDRVLRRRGEAPLGPPLLVREELTVEEVADPAAPATPPEPAPQPPPPEPADGTP